MVTNEISCLTHFMRVCLPTGNLLNSVLSTNHTIVSLTVTHMLVAPLFKKKI